VADLGNWRWSSLWPLFHKRQRPAALKVSTGLYYAGHLADTRLGRKAYLGYLDWLVESDQTRKELKFRNLSRGWALGTREFKKALVENDVVKGLDRAGRESGEARQLHWEGLLEKMLSFQGKGKADIAAEKKSAPWKVMIAYHLKRNTGVSNGWLSSHLGMGSSAGVSRYVSEFDRAGGPKGKVYRRMSAKIKT
jgi:putative transposase